MTFRISGGEVTLPNGIITNAHIATNAAIEAAKLKHSYKIGSNFGLEATENVTSANDKVIIVHVTTASGRFVAFHALLNDTGTDSSVEFDVLKNGVSILSSQVSVTHSESDGVPVEGTIGTDTFTVDDVITFEIAVSNSTGNPQGPFCWLDIEEDNAPA